PDTSHIGADLLDIGTANSIVLRPGPSRPVAATSPAAPVAAPQPQAATPQGPAAQTSMPQAQPPQNQAAQGQTVQGPAGATAGTFLFDPPTLNQAKGSTFTVNVMLSGGQNVYSVPVQLNYDPNQLSVINVSNGGFLSQDGQAVALVHRDDPTTGTLQVTATRPPGAGGVSGQGAVVTLTFMAKGSGQSALTITRGGARDPAMQPIAMAGAQAAITIQ
ncbi:MAG: cohesin domain-containing protein, partial [Terriglobales bacterium]